MTLTWPEVQELDPIRLNLGGYHDCEPAPLYRHYVAVDLAPDADFSVAHDLSTPIPLRDACVERVLSEQQELSGDKMGQILSISATNVYVMLYRARSALRECLERNWFGGKEAKGC